jgi:hypothetical protein
MQLLAVLAAEPGESGPATTLIVPLVGVMAAIVGLAKNALELLQTRIKKDLPQPAFRASSLRTEDAEAVPHLVGRKAGLISFFLFSLWNVWDIHRAGYESGWWEAAAYVTALLFALFSGIYLSQVWGKTAYEPVFSCKASLILDGHINDVATRCQQTLRALDAFKARGAYIATPRSNSIMIQGGIRQWPPFGQRITIQLRSLPSMKCFVRVESVSFFPGIFHKQRNLRIVKQIVRNLL